jgi:hypothetical protein
MVARVGIEPTTRGFSESLDVHRPQRTVTAISKMRAERFTGDAVKSPLVALAWKQIWKQKIQRCPGFKPGGVTRHAGNDSQDPDGGPSGPAGHLRSTSSRRHACPTRTGVQHTGIQVQLTRAGQSVSRKRRCRRGESPRSESRSCRSISYRWSIRASACSTRLRSTCELKTAQCRSSWRVSYHFPRVACAGCLAAFSGRPVV